MNKNFEILIENAIKMIKEKEGYNVEYEMKEIYKEGDVPENCAVISINGSNCLVIYENDYKDTEENEDAIHDLCDRILNGYEEMKNFLSKDFEENLQDYEFVKDKLFIRLIPFEKNEKFLDDKVWVRCNFDPNLVAVYCILIKGEKQLGVITISDEHFKLLGVSLSTLNEDAFKNTLNILDITVKNTSVLVDEVLPKELIEKHPDVKEVLNKAPIFTLETKINSDFSLLLFPETISKIINSEYGDYKCVMIVPAGDGVLVYEPVSVDKSDDEVKEMITKRISQFSEHVKRCKELEGCSNHIYVLSDGKIQYAEDYLTENLVKHWEQCGDNRFEVIAKAREALIQGTNIETSLEEMAVLDSFLFRAWQMGWLKQYE